MKKLLLGTTALISILSITAVAEELRAINSPTVKVGGLLDVQVGGKSQKDIYKLDKASNNQRDVVINSDAKVYVGITNRAEAGFTYGGVISLKTRAYNRVKKDSASLDNTYLFLESNSGRLELGSNYSAARAMRIDAGSNARATGGVTGDWADYITTDKYYGNNLILTPGLLGDKIMNSSYEPVRKITYYTPNMSGFQFGISYSPDSANVGSHKMNSEYQSYYSALYPRNVKNHFSGGLTYTQQLDQATVNLSVVSEAAKAGDHKKAINKHDLKGWELGGSVDYAGFSVAGSYGESSKKFINISQQDANDNINLSVTPEAKLKNAKYWTAGVGYVQGPAGLSVNYLASNYQNNKLKNIAVSADYKLAPGFLPYAEASFFDIKAADKSMKKNKGKVYLFGTKLQF